MAQIILDSNNNLIQGDFDNATLNNRTKLQTTTTNATTNVYVVPNGSSTSAGVSVANNSSLTNASKIVMATNGTTDTQIISGVNGSGTYLPMSFYTNNALAMQITTGGIISAAGGGIQFPAVQIPSADANTLDDYEEGSWTPTVTGQSTAGTYTYDIRAGNYIKIGKIVVASFTLTTITASSAGTGGLTVTGFPFTAGGTSSYGERAFNVVSRMRSMANARSNVIVILAANSTIGYYVYDNGGTGGGTDIPISDISSGNSQLGATVVYTTA
jgi:hypothetical protein